MRETKLIVVRTLLALSVTLAVGDKGSAADFPVSYETRTRQELRLPERVSHAAFEQTAKVDGLTAGLIGDGRTDNTAAFRRLFSRPGQNVSIGPGDFRTGKFVILSDTVVTFAAGTVIRDSGQLGPNDPLMQIYGKHVSIVGNGAKILENRADYRTDEGRHGVAMIGVADISIDGLESSSSGGDGFYIGGAVGKPSVDVTLVNCVARNNRRQGLSITNARRIEVIDSTFSQSAGNKPEFGVDLEPNHKTDYLDRILLSGISTSGNRGGGVLIWLNQLDNSSPPVDITIVDHRSTNERAFVADMGGSPVRGSVRYVRLR